MFQGWLTRVLRDLASFATKGEKLERRAGGLRLRHVAIALFAMLTTLAPTLAAASTGCAAVNAGALNQTTVIASSAVSSTDARQNTGAVTFQGVNVNLTGAALAQSRWYPGGPHSFAVGDTISVTMVSNGPLVQFQRSTDSGGTVTNIGVGGGTYSYSPTATEFAFQTRIAPSTDGTATTTATCTPAPPTISGLSPNEGPTAGGTSVTLTGQNFLGASVTVDGVTVTPGTHTDTSIVFTTPAHAAGTVSVAVTTTGGTALSSFTYVAPPTVTSVTPNAGPLTSGTSVTLAGTNFLNASAVTFGGTPAVSFVVNGASQITAVAPAGSASTVNVRVTTVGGTSATATANQYTFVAAPTISSLTPSSGPTGGGNSVNIAGTGLLNATLTVDGVTVTPNSTSPTSVVFITPAHAAGSVPVVVTTAGGSASSSFNYVAAPTISSLSPTSGTTAGGTSVTISGTNLSGATLTVDGATVTPTSTNPTSIVFTTPAHASGSVPVAVTTAGGTATSGFTFVAPPIAGSASYGSIVAYNDGSNLTTNINLSFYLTGGDTPTSYAVGSATTAQGGSVSVNSSGDATYTPPVGYRNANDSFTYTATNAGGTSAPATVTVTVGNPTISVTLPSATGTVERVYNAGGNPVTFSGGRATYTVNSISGLPSGLSAVGAVISGTPAVQGTFTVTVNVTDSSLGAGPYNANTTATLSVGTPPAPVTSSFSISGLTYNTGSATATTFSAAPHATESPTGYQVGASSYGGTVSVDSAGLMSYTPPVGFRGTDTFNWVATNAGGTSNVSQVFVTVNDPVFSVTLPASTGTVGVAYNGVASPVTISGGNPPYNSYSATGLPAGLTMNSSGVISGTPTTATNATVVVTVTDNSGGNGSYTSTASASLSIALPNITLSPAAGALPGAQAGASSYSQGISASGSIAPYTFAVTAGALPPGMSLSSGTISGTPTSTGTFNFTITATDSSGNNYQGQAAYSITVSAPTIAVASTPDPLPQGTVAASYSASFSASGGTGPYTITLDSGTLPDGLSFAAGGISGTPTEGGSFPIVIRAQDSTAGGTYSGTQNFTLIVDAPTIVLSPASPLTGGTIAAPYTATVSASGGTAGYTFAVTSGSLPPGLSPSLVGGNLQISGTPTGAGTYNFIVTATDSSTGGGSGAGGAYTGALPYAITIAAPTLSLAPNTPVTNATIASAYTRTFTASGGTAPYTYSWAGDLPTGMTITGNVLSGTPTEGGGPFNFSVTATDSSAGTGPFQITQNYGLTVDAPTITVSPGSLTAVATGTTVNQTITASGGTAGYTFSHTGTLPTGLGLSTGGQITGTTTAAGTFNFTITAQDASTGAGPYTGSQAYSWTIDAPTIALDPISPANGQIGVAYNRTLTATGGVAPYQYAVVGAMPAGLSLSSSGQITGTPTHGGAYSFTVTATDSSTGAGAPFLGTRTYTGTFNNPALTLTPSTLSGMKAGVAYTATITAGGGTAPYTYSMFGGTVLPPGLSLSTTGEITGTPTASGTFSFTIAAQDFSTGIGPYTVARAYTNVVVDAPTLTITTAAGLPAATQHTAYNQAIDTAGGTAPYQYSVVSGATPPGIVLGGGGVLSGTPTAVGSYTFTVRSQDSTTGGAYATTKAFTLEVNVPAPPTANAVSATVAANSTTNTIAPNLTGVPATSVAIASAPSHGTATLVGAGASATFDYVPTAGFSGTDSFTYTGGNAGGSSAPATVSVTVTAPTLVVAGTPVDGIVATAYPGATFTASTGTAPYTFTVVGASLPTGLTLSTAGVLSGTPTAAGTFSAVIKATDAYGAEGQATFPINILAPLVTITAPTAGALPTATAFVPYSQTFTATGGVAPHTFAVTSGALPAGLTLTPAGALSGSATVTGSFAFTVTASDGSVAPGPYPGPGVAYTLVVGAPAMTLSPAAGPLPAGTATVPYTATFSAAGGTSPYSYAVTAGALPNGLTLSAGGVISGAALQSATGVANFTVTATDANGFPVSQAYSVDIAQVTLVTASPANGVVGQSYNQVLSTSGGTGPYSYSVTGVLPAGLSLSSSGVLSGLPTAAGTFGFSVTATDSFGAVGTDALSMDIASPTMTLSPTSAPAADYGMAYSLTFQATGGVTPYRYALSGTLPTGLSLDTTSGVLSGTPTEAGSFPIVVTASDSSTGPTPFSTSVSLTLVVNPAPPPVVEPVSTETDPGQPTTIDVSSLIDGFYDSVIITRQADHGTAVVNGGAARMRSQSGGPVTITYTPNPGYYGTDSFSYAATGPGGTSAPAAITVAVAAPAPVVVNDTASLNANATVVIPVTANDTGPISTIAIATAPTNGTATISGLNVTYAPAQNFFGTDTFTYTATGEGGTGGPATVTVTVAPLAVPAQSAQTITVLAGQSVTLAATQGATGGPFTGVAVVAAPTKGAAAVNGETIVYTPATGFSGSDSFTYRISNPFGDSAPIPVTVTVNPAPLTAPPITVEILAGQKAVVNLVSGASGGPFIGAAVVAVTPAGSGAAVVTNPSSGAYTLTFTPDNAFAGTAVVTYTLTNAFATSAPGRVNVIVTARPDPSKDPEVKGLIAAQDAAAIRFADAQISNFNRRLEQLHNGGGAGRGFGVSVRGGDVERDDGLEARERFRKYASLGMNDAADPSSPLLPEAKAGYSAQDDGEDGQAGPKRWGVWAAGSADFGMRDAVGSQSGFRFTTDGLTGGVDYRVNEDFAFGLGLGYGRDSSRIGKSGTKSRAESYSAGLYASLKTGEKTFIDGVLGYGTLDFDTRRYVTTTGELVNGERDGDQVFAALTFGMEHRTPTSLLSPYGRFAFSRSQLDAFSEDGGGPYGLTYHAQTVKSLTGTLGLRGEFLRKTAAGLLAPRFRVEYSHDFEKANDALLSYTDWVGGPTYRLTVDPIDRDQLRLELGADLTIKNGIRFGLDFDNMVSKDSDSQGVRLSIQSPF